jgi:CheY-like chemotaxis protein
VKLRRAVLVVEDDRPIRDSMVQVLQDEGYAVLVAIDGSEALRLLRDTPELPGLILLDLMMPTMDGFQFRAEQLADPRLSSIPVVVLSADVNVFARAETLHVQGVLKKPLSLDALLGCVEQHCG